MNQNHKLLMYIETKMSKSVTLNALHIYSNYMLGYIKIIYIMNIEKYIEKLILLDKVWSHVNII
jgi:hypothetical protein